MILKLLTNQIKHYLTKNLVRPHHRKCKNTQTGPLQNSTKNDAWVTLWPLHSLLDTHWVTPIIPLYHEYIYISSHERDGSTWLERIVTWSQWNKVLLYFIPYSIYKYPRLPICLWARRLKYNNNIYLIMTLPVHYPSRYPSRAL